MKDLLIILGYAVGVGEIFLAAYFWRTNSGSQIRRVLVFLALATSLWVLSIVSIAYAQPGIGWENQFKLAYVFGPLMSTVLLHFALVYPIPSIRLDRWHVVLLYVPWFIFAWITLASFSVVATFRSSATFSGEWTEGVLFPPYAVIIASSFVAAMTALLMKQRVLDGMQKKNLTIVILAVLVGGLPALLVDVVIPMFTGLAQYPYIGTLSTGIWLGTMSYMVTRK